MTLRPLIVLSIVALLLFTGCATVSFKRGAGPGNAKADEDACRASSTSAEAYADCLRQRGWMVSTPGRAAEPAVAPEPASAAPVAPATTKPSSAVDAAPHGAPPTHGGPRGGAPIVEPTPGSAGKPDPARTSRSAAAPAPIPSPVKKLDPMTKVTVSSWWKMGGTNADLDAAVKACVDELGPAHAPNTGPTEVTVALRECLRGKKWFAVGGTGGIGAERFTR
jgi:uncharacterized protein YceK